MKQSVLTYLSALVIAISLCSCEGLGDNNNLKVRDTADIVVSIALYPEFLNYFDATITFTDPRGEEVTMPVKKQDLTIPNYQISWMEELLNFTVNSYPVDTESFQEKTRLFSFPVKRVTEWKTTGYLHLDKKADASDEPAVFDMLFATNYDFSNAHIRDVEYFNNYEYIHDFEYHQSNIEPMLLAFKHHTLFRINVATGNRY